MSITYEQNVANFSSVIYEDEVVPFRDFLQEKAGDALNMNFTECKDIHLAILQLIMAYKKNYECTYKFAEQKRFYQTVLEGFDPSENNCN